MTYFDFLKLNITGCLTSVNFAVTSIAEPLQMMRYSFTWESTTFLLTCCLSLQCFDTVGCASGRARGL